MTKRAPESDYTHSIPALRIATGELLPARLFHWEESADGSVLQRMEYHVEGTVYAAEGGGDQAYPLLCQISLLTEKDGLLPRCNGTAKRFVMSGLAGQFSGGTRGQLATLGQHTTTEDIVDVFDYQDGEEIVTVKEQEEWHQLWMKTPKQHLDLKPQEEILEALKKIDWTDPEAIARFGEMHGRGGGGEGDG